MAFLRKKKTAGKTYWQTVESYRDPETGKVKQRVLKYHGKTKPKAIYQEGKTVNKAMSQKGSEANRTGSNHRSKVKALLIDSGFSVQENYKPEGYTDFADCQITIPLYAWSEAFPNGIAFCPFYQGVSGTAYMKLPVLWMKITSHYPCPAVVVADGQGLECPFASAYIDWLKGSVDGSYLAGVFTYKELKQWLKQTDIS